MMTPPGTLLKGKPLLALTLSSLLVLSIIPLAHMANGQQSTFDFGDAPDGGATGYPAPFAQTGSFPSLLASDGARVQSTSDATLGPTASMEANALLVNGDADDGVSELVILTVSIPPPAKLSVTVNGQQGGSGGTFYVNVLIDLNLDGEWAGTTVNGQPEWVIRNFPTTVTPGDSSIVPLPEFAFSNGNALPAGAWMRIALTKEQVTASDWDGSGEFSSGEIEDHVIALPVVGGKTPAMPVIENCQPNPALFPPGGTITMFTCDIFSPQPGFATVTFNCVPDTVAIIPLGFGQPYAVGPAKVTLNFIASKGASPPPRVNCIVTASSQDPPSVVTPTGVTVGFADSTTTAAFDTTDEDANAQTYAAISETAFAYKGNNILRWNSFYAGVPITIRNSIANTTPEPLNATYIVQVLDEEGAAVHIWSQDVNVPAGEDYVDVTSELTLPEPGDYFVHVFAWDALDRPTTALSFGKSTELALAELLPTRPVEWWAVRPNAVEEVWGNVVAKDLHLQCGEDFSVDSMEKVMGVFWFEPEEGQSLSEVNEAWIALAREIIAARLNEEAFGGIPDDFDLTVTQAEALFCSPDIDQTGDMIDNRFLEILGTINTSASDVDIQIGIDETVDEGGIILLADMKYMDLYYHYAVQLPPPDEEPLEEEQDPPTPPEPDTSEMTFAHKVGDTDCPQFIGSIFLEDMGIEGEWIVADQPEWLNVDVSGNFAEFYFNCFIEDTSSHTIEEDVQFDFLAEDEESEIDPFHVTVSGEIINPEEE